MSTNFPMSYLTVFWAVWNAATFSTWSKGRRWCSPTVGSQPPWRVSRARIFFVSVFTFRMCLDTSGKEAEVICLKYRQRVKTFDFGVRADGTSLEISLRKNSISQKGPPAWSWLKHVSTPGCTRLRPISWQRNCQNEIAKGCSQGLREASNQYASSQLPLSQYLA